MVRDKHAPAEGVRGWQIFGGLSIYRLLRYI